MYITIPPHSIPITLESGILKIGCSISYMYMYMCIYYVYAHLCGVLRAVFLEYASVCIFSWL